MPLHVRTTKTTAPQAKTPENELGFGKHFSDHMLLCDYEAGTGWHDARVVPYAPLSLDPAAGVLHYGQAMFEGLKAFRQPDGSVSIFRAEAHGRRMERGAERLCMPGLPPEDFIAAMKAFVSVERDWVPSLPGTSLYLRPTLVATEPFLGVRPSNRYLFFVIASPVGSYYGGDSLKPVRIWVEREYVRAPRGGLGSTKAGANYVASLYAATKAKKAGYDQVLWLDGREHAFVEEVGTMNLFVIIGQTLITPALGDSILAGVTRESILTLATDLGLKAEERSISVAELFEAKKNGSLREIFGSGTAAVVSPVGELAFGDERLVVHDGTPGEVARQLFDEISGIQQGKRPDRHRWLEPV
ncbi:MAG: branched-chain amino acid aminotransferase [Polyangiaceae bacterium]